MNETIIIDCGSFSITAGLASDKQPAVTTKRSDLSSKKNSIEKVLQDLPNRPNVTNAIILSSFFESSEAKKEMLKIFFNHFNFENVAHFDSSVASLYAKNFVTGLVVDMGHESTIIMPIVESTPIFSASKILKISGKNISKNLKNFLKNEEVSESKIESLKKDCFVAYDFQAEQLLTDHTTKNDIFFKSAQRDIKLSFERFYSTEIYFNPSLFDLECSSLPDSIFECIQRSPIDVRAALMSKIVISGGSSQFPGLVSRLKKELEKLFLEKVFANSIEKLKKYEITLHTDSDAPIYPYMGAAKTLKILENEPNFFINRADFLEGNYKFL